MLRDGRATLAGALLAVATRVSVLGVDSGLEPPMSGCPDCTVKPSAASLLQVSRDPANSALGCVSPDLHILDEAYQSQFFVQDAAAYGLDDSDKKRFKARDEMDANGYGELLPRGFMDLMCKVGARPGYRFYDLGSGVGKTVAIAWLLGMQAQGVELSEKRWNMSCSALGNLVHASRPAGAGEKLKFIRGSFLELDFSDADLIFTDSVLFTDEMMRGLAEIASGMRAGARVITWKEFPGAWFKTIMTAEEPCSWDNTKTPYKIQERVSHEIAPRAATTLSSSTHGAHCSL